MAKIYLSNLQVQTVHDLIKRELKGKKYHIAGKMVLQQILEKMAIARLLE